MDNSSPLSLDPCFGKLGREIRRFANHTNRFVVASQKFRDLLTQASEWTEGTAPLTRAPTSPMAAMRAIDKFARIHRAPRQTLFGSYFAHHHLRSQAELSRTLLRESISRPIGQRAQLCDEVYRRSVKQRRAWITALLETTIAASTPGLRREDYAIFNVGALTDHEDVDLAIVVASVEAREQFAAGFAPLTKTFLRFASKIQFFLAEQLVNPRAGGLIEEYEEIIEGPFSNVVVVMQLLGAQFLCGSQALAKRFTERITTRFYAQIGDPLLHEGFLRSVGNELKHYLSPEEEIDTFAPKQQIYIPSRLIIASLRVIHGVNTPYPVRALDDLVTRHPVRADSYRALKRTFVQNEVLRALVFLYVVKSDEIDLYDPMILKPARRVASLLGLRRSARKSADARLWAYYKDLRAQNTRVANSLAEQIETHLNRVSTFQQTIAETQPKESEIENYAVRFLQSLRQFKRGVFWDEVVAHLSDNPELRDKFFEGLNRLRDEEQRKMAHTFISMMSFNATAVVEFLIFVGRSDTSNEVAASSEQPSMQAQLFWDALLNFVLEASPSVSDFLYHLDSETEMAVLFNLAEIYPTKWMADFANAVEQNEEGSRGERIVRKLRSIIVLVHHHANRLRRLRNRILERSPKYVDRLGDPERARKLSQKLKTQAAHELSHARQLQHIGDAFDISIMNTSLNAILDGAPATRDQEYIAAFDDYIRATFKICFRDVQARSHFFERIRPGAGFALYATGGYGRNQGFGADFDYIAVVHEQDGRNKKFFSKVVQRLESVILKRGVIPHNRLSHEFNSYVIGIKELQEHLRTRGNHTFVDEAEILESRFILGDLALQRLFTEKVIGLVLGENRKSCITDLLTELSERRSTLPVPVNIKFGYGGLREIQLLRLALGALVKKPNLGLSEILAEPGFLEKSQRSHLRFLSVGYDELRRIRDLFRLVVAGKENPMDIESFIQIAEHLPPLQAMGVRPHFEREIINLMTTCGKKIDILAADIERAISKENVN